MVLLLLAPTDPHKSNTDAQQILPSQQHFHLNGSFATVNMAQGNMDQMLQPCSPFPREVDAFTTAYLSPVSSIFPIFPPNARHTPSVTTQGQVTYSLPSISIHTSSQAYNDRITQNDMARFRSHFKESLNVAPDLGKLTPANGLGITCASQASVPLTPPESHRHVASDRKAPSTPKNQSKGESSNGTSFGRSPSTRSMLTTRNNSESDANKQEKKELGFDPSNLKTGFTPLIKQEESTRPNDNHQRKKIRLTFKGSSAPTTPVSSSTASFGPPLQSVKGQNQSTFIQSSSNVQANSSHFSHQQPAPNKSKKFAFLALNPQHAEYLRIQMEKQLSSEMREMVEIRTVAPQAQASPAAKRSTNAQPALAKSQKQRLVALDEQHVEKMRKSMTPQMQETVEIVLISQLQGEVRPRVTINLTTSHQRTTTTITLRGPPTEFHRFPSLPPELQHRIWTFTLPGPRTIHLTTPAHPGLDIFLPTCRPPTTLQVCAQSRTIALRTLQPAFQNTLLLGAYTYFDFSVDVLRLGDGHNVEAAKKMALSTDPGIASDRKRVRHLEIPLQILHTRHMYNCLAALICLAPARGWPGLRTLTFSGEARNGGVPVRMPVIEVVKGSEEVMMGMIGLLVGVMRREFRMVWEELWVMPDCGLKVVYLEEGESE